MADTDTTPTPPADPKGKPGKTEKDKGPNGPILVVIHREGIYQASRHEAKEPPKGAGKADPQQRIEVHTLRLFPGLNLVDRDLWTKVYNAGSHTGLRQRIAKQSLEIIGGITSEWSVGWAKVSGPTKIVHVRGTTVVETLEQMLDVEPNEEVANAMRETLAAIRGDTVMGRMARASQRTKHRTAIRRR